MRCRRSEGSRHDLCLCPWLEQKFLHRRTQWPRWLVVDDQLREVGRFVVESNFKYVSIGILYVIRSAIGNQYSDLRRLVTDDRSHYVWWCTNLSPTKLQAACKSSQHEHSSMNTSVSIWWSINCTLNKDKSWWMYFFCGRTTCMEQPTSNC